MWLADPLTSCLDPCFGTSGIRRPRTPYTLFMQDVSRNAKNPSPLEYKDVVIPKGTFMQRVAKMWRELPEIERERYVELAALEQKNYRLARKLQATKPPVGKSKIEMKGQEG